MFKLPHLQFLLFTLLTVPMIAFYLKKLTPAALQGFYSKLVVIVVCFDPVYWIWEWVNFGKWNWPTTLPLYICSLFWLLLPLAVHGKTPWLVRMTRATIASVVLFAGIFGLVFNTHLNAHEFLSFVPIRSLLYHYLMIMTSVSFLTTGYYKPRAKDALISMIPVYVLLVPCITLSYLFGWDYSFTAGGIGTPLETLSSMVAKPVYLFILYGFATLVIQLFHFSLNFFKISTLQHPQFTVN